MIGQSVGEGPVVSGGRAFLSIENATVTDDTVADGTLTDDEEGREPLETCSRNESFTVTAAAQPCLEGCYTYTDFTGLGVTYSTLETFTWPQAIVTAPNLGDESVLVLWWLMDIRSASEGVVYCFSDGASISAHPSNATWNCDLTGDQDFRLVTAADLQVVCGCSGVPGSPPPTCDAPVGANHEGFSTAVILVVALSFVIGCAPAWLPRLLKLLQRCGSHTESRGPLRRDIELGATDLFWTRRGWLVILRSREQEPTRNRWLLVTAGRRARRKLSECAAGSRKTRAELYKYVLATVLIQEEGLFRDIVEYL